MRGHSISPEIGDLARRIEHELILAGSEEGYLGSQKALMLRFGVGRPTLQMAARELESRAIAAMRPGPRGGLYRCTPDYPPAALTLANYIMLNGVRHSDILDVHAILYLALIERAASERDPENRVRLRHLMELYLAPPHSIPRLQHFQGLLWRCLTDMAHAAMLSLWLHSIEWIQRTIVLNAVQLVENEQRLVQMVKAWDRRIMRAILDGDGQAAAQFAKQQLIAIRRVMDRSIAQGELPNRAQLRNPFKCDSGAGSPRLAIPTTRALQNHIADRGLPAGHRLGTIEGLASQFGVSSEVMRQAIRLAQTHGLVRSMAGRNGGVFTGTLSATRTMQVCADYYSKAGIAQEQAQAAMHWLTDREARARSKAGVRTIVEILRETLATYLAEPDCLP